MSKRKKDRLVWIDLEMTGLDPAKCTVLEIGAIVTDGELDVVAEGPSFAIHHSEKILRGMEPWSKHHHKKSGLTGECRASRVSMRKAEDETLAFLKKHCVERTAPLCGNTVWQDRRFLVKYMPRLERFLHYRVVDVSSVKELVSRWYPEDHKMPRQKNQSHRVMDDIRESIEEMRFYRRKVFVKPPHQR